MAESLLPLSPERFHTHSGPLLLDDDMDMTFHDPPSSPFLSHLEYDDQENLAPHIGPPSSKPIVEVDEHVDRPACRVSPEKKQGLKERPSPTNMSPAKNLMSDFEEAAMRNSMARRTSPAKISPSKQSVTERSESALGDNEGLTVAINYMEETQTDSLKSATRHSPNEDRLVVDLDMDNTDFHVDGPEITSADVDDTCFSTFSEMPGLDMTKFAFLKQSPTKGEPSDATPRVRSQMTPSTVRRSERTPSPTPYRAYKENDTTNLLLDFTAQIESFSSSRRTSPARGRPSPSKNVTQPDLRTYYQTQRSPAKGASCVPATPSQSRQMFNLLDFELPPPPTPRSLPTVTIRELESVKSQFQSQVSSLTASLSGKEAEVDSLAKAIADAERRVGEAQETVRDERSAREYAEAQMTDWKKKGEEVQKLLQDVQAELARNDNEREQLLARLAEAEKHAEDAENRSSDLETKLIEAESKNVDMTTFINTEEDENKKIYSEMECQAAIAEKVNEVARELHTAYKAKHEKKIKALKDNYQRKADERCKELRLQIIRLERQVEEAEKKRDNTFSKILPGGVAASVEGQCEKCGTDAKAVSPLPASNAEDVQMLESQRAEIESLKAKLAGLQSELQSLRKSHDGLFDDLQAERIEKGELVAAAEQMLAMCGEKMEEMQQEDLRRSQVDTAPPSAPQPRQPAEHAMRNTGFLAGSSTSSRPGSALAGGRPTSALGDRLGVMNERSGSGIAKPSGLRAPGGFGFQGGSSSLSKSTNGGKSRLLSNIERMGGGRAQE